MTTTCFQCHKEVNQSETRTIGQCIEVCTGCYRDLKTLIIDGYFDVPKIESEMVFEAGLQRRIGRFA